jgi:nucleotide-binding universal stress UspA family protein
VTSPPNTLAEDAQVQLIVAHGSIYRQVARAAEDVGAGLIIMASHTPDASDLLIGPNAEKVLHHFRGSVMVVRR